MTQSSTSTRPQLPYDMDGLNIARPQTDGVIAFIPDGHGGFVVRHEASPEDMTSPMPNINFDLNQLPSSQPVAAPAPLSPTERLKAARELAQSMDMDHDGRLSAMEAYHSVRTSIDGALRNEFNEPLQNAQLAHLGRLGLGQRGVSAVIDDVVVSDAAVLSGGFRNLFGLSAEQIQQVLAEAFPHGIETLNISDVCRASPQMNCMPLPSGKIAIFSGPGSRG